MGLIATQDKRDKLRLFFKTAQDTGKSLKDVLMASLAACDAVAPNGTWLSSTSEAGGSASFSVLQSLSPEKARRLVGELLDLYDQVVAYLPTTTPATAVNDFNVYTQMMGIGPLMVGPRLHRVGSFQADYTGLRYGCGTNIASQ